jgi:tryptophan halogenase
MTPKRVLIVGGGSAGWMAAAHLEAALRNNGQRPVEIAVIEPPDGPRMNLTEAAIPDIKHFLAVVGIDEIELLKRVDGTFRQATKYVNWLRGTGDFYYQPFDDSRAQPIDRAALQWLMSDRSIAFAETTSPQPIICDLGLAPKPLDGQPAGVPLKYAYHMDALKFTDMLSEVATSRGVQRHLDHVTEVEMSGNGDIAAVLTRAGQRLEADLFLDCSGLEALLIGKLLGVDWVDCSQWLLCDREITMNVDYEHHYSGRVPPYTTATALSAGWVCEIPLQNRKTLGYVHCSRYIDEEDACQEMRAFEGRHARSLDTHTVNFNVGHRAKTWARNCVALGLSGGFIEPLESTGLCLGDLGTVTLAEYFPFDDDMAPFAYRYNRIMANRFYEILDFINLHYCLTKRKDTEFWREVGKPGRINDRLRAKLDFWRSKVPSKSDFVDQCFPGSPEMHLQTGGLPGDHRSPVDTGAVFGLESYEAVLYGMQFLADECDDWFGAKRPRTQVPDYIVNDLKRAPAMLPPHEVWLKSAARMPDYPVSPETRR